MPPRMVPWLLALSLAAVPAAVNGQVALEQHHGELAVREGEGGTFQCSMRGDNMRSYYMVWYQQKLQGSLTLIYQEDGDTYGAGFRGRFEGKVESSQNRFTLRIQAAKQEDEAVYYCGARLTLEQVLSRVEQELAERESRQLSTSSRQPQIGRWRQAIAGSKSRPFPCLQGKTEEGGVFGDVRGFMTQL